MTRLILPATFVTDRFADAVAYASALHATQIRKGTRVPYVAHLLAVASLVLEAEGDEDMAIGGLLHDAAEDQGGERRLHDIEARYGATVSGYVRACTDYLGDDPANKPPWRARKEQYLADLPGHGVKAVIVSMADKVHNARAIWTDLLNGVDVATKFKPEADVLWYYGECLRIAEEFDVPTAIRTPLAQAVEGIRVELDAIAEPSRSDHAG
jgi:(p)ppGpp synthase/HD superfamily hydrolase